MVSTLARIVLNKQITNISTAGTGFS